MAESSRPWTETPAGATRPAHAHWRTLLAPALRQAVRLGPVALAGAWIGYYLITDLPYIDPETFRATLALHVVTAAVLIPYLVSLVVARRLPGGSVLDAPLVALAAVYLLATAASVSWRVSLEVALTALMALGVFYVLSDARLLRRWQVEAAFMLAVLASAVWALWIVGGDYLDWLRLNDAVGGLSFGDLIPPTVPKIRDVGDHPNLLGGILAMSLPFFLIAFFRPVTVALRVVLGVALVAIVLAIFLSLARSAWLGATAGALTTALLLLIATPAGRRLLDHLRPTTPSGQWLIGAVALGLAAMIFAATYVTQSVEARPLWLFRPSATPRWDVMQAGGEMVKDYPLLGTGPGMFGLLYPEYSGQYPNHAFHSHNGFLQTAVDLGAPGVLAMLALAGATGWLIIRGLRTTEGDARLSVIASAGALVAFGTFSLFDAPNAFKGPLVALAAVGAIAVLSARERTQTAEAPPSNEANGWQRSGFAFQLVARGAVAVALAGLLITWGRLDVGHYFYSTGIAEANAGNFSEAIDDARRAVNVDPQFAIYRLQLGTVRGQAYLATGNERWLDGAVSELERGLELEPRSAIGHANLAMLLARSGDRGGARGEALKAREFANNDPAVVLAAGTALERANWGDEAVEAYSHALFLDPRLADSPFWSDSPFREQRFPDIVAGSAIIFSPCGLLELARGDSPVAKIIRNDAIERCRDRIAELDDAGDRVVLANALIDDGSLDEALIHIDNVIDRQPDNGPARTAFGRWHTAKDDIDAAREQWLLAAQLKDVEALVFLGDSYPEGEVPGEVVSALRSELDRSASEVQRHLIGILYYRFKFQRASPHTILLPGEWQQAVPGDYARAQDALERWTEP